MPRPSISEVYSPTHDPTTATSPPSKRSPSISKIRSPVKTHLFEGQLWKFSAEKRGLMPSRWTQRWFVVEESCLQYFVKAISSEATPRRCIYWTDIISLYPTATDEMKQHIRGTTNCYFGIRYKEGDNNRLMILGADCEEERQSWVEILKKYIPTRRKSVNTESQSPNSSRKSFKGRTVPQQLVDRVIAPVDYHHPSEEHEDVDKPYFAGYSSINIHEEMLRDSSRTESYYNAIMGYQSLFQGKVVIDVGCGTGVLSIFSAWAGARRVYAIEASDMAHYATNIVRDNQLEHVISVVHGKVEECELVDEFGYPVVADVIISEWMGYFLVFEAMYESVLYARDKWLAPDGVMFPTHAVMYLSPFSKQSIYNDKILFWQDVYGVNMSAMSDLARSTAFETVVVDTVDADQVLAPPQVVKSIDCRIVTVEELRDMRASFTFQCNVRGNFHGFIGWFSVYFCPLGVEGPQTVLSTGPEDVPTHWRQSLFFTGDQLWLNIGQEIEGQVEVCQNAHNHRFIDVNLHWTIKPSSIPRYIPESSNLIDRHRRIQCEAQNPPLHHCFRHSKHISFYY